MVFDLSKVRLDTPTVNKLIHFNNAGASLIPLPVSAAVSCYFQMELERGGYETEDYFAEELNGFYTAAAKLISAHPEEIAYIENATRAWDMVFYSLFFKAGDKILTTKAEYASNYIALLQVAQKTGAVIEIIPNDHDGQLCISSLKKMLTPNVKLISITHVPTQGGLINPAEEVGKLAQLHGAFYLLDATQSVGQMPIEVNTLHCDALCATGRKYLRGPRGTGFLYVKKSRIAELEPPFLDLKSATLVSKTQYTINPDATRFETWERNGSNMLGLKAAIEYALSLDIEMTWARIQTLSARLRDKLSSIPGVTVRDLGVNKCGIVTFTVDGIEAEDISAILRKKGINTSVSRAAYARLDFEDRGLTSLVRASVHYYNTDEEIDRFCEEILCLRK
jgi:cysteine desulfurase/selenocysteine lyase